MVASGMPAMQMEIAFTTPFAASPTWTDVSAYVMLDKGITWQRGRGDPLALCQPGTSSWTLDNYDGRFIPNRSASPYYPNIKINRAVRFTVVWLGVTYRMFTHFTDPWQTDMEGGFKPISPMTATDRFKMFARKKLSKIYVEEISSDGPSALYMMGESVNIDQPVSMSSLDTTGNVGFNQALYPRGDGNFFSYGNQGPFADGSTAITLAAKAGKTGAAIPYIPDFMSVPFTVEFWASISGVDDDNIPNYGYLYSMQGPTSGIRGISIYCNSVGGTLTIQVARPVMSQGGYDPDQTTWVSASTGISYRDDLWHHYVGTLESVGGGYQFKLYIDGTLSVTAATPSGSLAPFPTTTGMFQSFGMDFSTGSRFPLYVSIAGIAFYSDVLLSPARILVHYTTGKDGGYGELSGARLERLLRYSMTPVSARTYAHSFPENLDTGISVMNMQDTENTSAMDAISTAVQAEQGMLWVQGDGTIRFKDRDAFWNPALDFTISADQVGSDFSIVVDDTLLINTCTATRKYLVPFVARNSISQDEYGVYDDSVPDVPVSDQLLVDFARYRVSKYSTPGTRSYTVIVTPSVTTALFPVMLACEPGQRFTVTSLPFPLPSSLDLVVQHVEHDVTPDRWETRIIGAPTDMSKYAVWDTPVTTWASTTLWGW
jgi:hypothetical protein